MVLNTPITLPLNSKYRPDPKAWVCTYPYFVKSRLLVCKHLIQSVPTMPPTLFLKVTCHRTTPFWHHPALQLTEGGQTPSTYIPVEVEFIWGDHRHQEEDEQDIVDMEATRPGECKTLHEWVAQDIQILWEFCDGMEYQLQFDNTITPLRPVPSPCDRTCLLQHRLLGV